jgi:(S)-6-hydroxynicotine oxidase
VSESHEVVVVGGGLAGLRSARDPSEQGLDVLVLEGRDRLGGRTWARAFPDTDVVVEVGGSWLVPARQPWVSAEIARYGLELAPEHPKKFKWAWRFDGGVTTELPLDFDQRYDLERALYELVRASHRVNPDVARDQLADLDVSVACYLQALGLSRRTLEFLSAFGALGAGAAAEDWSALTAISLVADFGHSALAWFAAVSRTLRGGTPALVNALAQGGAARVNLEADVTRVEQDDLEVRITTRDGRLISAAAAVIAVPVNVWSDIAFSPALSEAKSVLATSRHPGRMKKVWALVEGAPANTQGFGFGNDFVLLAPHSDVAGAGLMVGFAAPPTGVQIGEHETVQAGVAEYFPDATVLETDGHDWNTDPFAKGAWLTHPPGYVSAHGFELPRREGRLCFAGSDLAQSWVGWMDGALSTGAAAAAEALEIVRSGR